MIRNRRLHYFTFAKKHFAVWVTLGLCLLIGEGILDEPCRLAAATDEPEEFHGPPPHPGYPDPFEIGYILFDTFSPNKQFGIIYPNRLLEESPDFIVDLKHSRILAVLETGEPISKEKTTAIWLRIGLRTVRQRLLRIAGNGNPLDCCWSN